MLKLKFCLAPENSGGIGGAITVVCISKKGHSCLTHLSTVTSDWCEVTTWGLAAGSPCPAEFVIFGSADTAGHGKEDGTKGYYYSTIKPKPKEPECLDLCPGSATYQLCDPGQATNALCLSFLMDSNST